MSSRDRILERLRQTRPPTDDLPEPVPDRDVFADYPADDLAMHFANVLGELSGEVIAVPDIDAAGPALANLVETTAEAQDGIVATEEPLVQQVVAAAGLGKRCARRLPPASDAASVCGIGITGAAALVARTGSVVIRTTDSGRRPSVLPPVHVVIAARDAVVASLEDATKILAGNKAWSYAAIISGPSRTADIEKILVLGAHGPRRLVVILVG